MVDFSLQRLHGWLEGTTTTLHPFNGLLSRTTWVSQHQKGKTSLDSNVAREDDVLGSSGISWTTCKQPAPRSRQIGPNHTNTPSLNFSDRTLFLTPNQQCQITPSNRFVRRCQFSNFTAFHTLVLFVKHFHSDARDRGDALSK